MGLFDGTLKTVSEHADVENLAAKLGLDASTTEGAIAALARSHQEPGDTVSAASGKTGLPADTLRQIIAEIGGEGSLTEFARVISDKP